MPAKTRSKNPNLVAAVNESVRNMPWLTEADQALVDLALKYAHQIEEAQATGTPHQRDKMLGWLGPHLSGTMKALGGSPTERKADFRAIKPVKSRLAELRAVRESS